MTQKTNQFNTTTMRFSEAQLAERLRDRSWWTATIDVNDRFGSHGITGLLMAQVHSDYLEIETFLLSCRVIGRTVETAALARFAQRARSLSLRQIKGRIVHTTKNMPVRDLYERHGFRQDPTDETVWWLDLGENVIQEPAWLKVIEREAA